MKTKTGLCERCNGPTEFPPVHDRYADELCRPCAKALGEPYAGDRKALIEALDREPVPAVSTSTEIVVRDPQPITPAEQQVRAGLDSFTEKIPLLATVTDAADELHKAEAIRAAATKLRMSEETRREIGIIECRLVRQIGVLDPGVLGGKGRELSSSVAAAARWFAGLSDREFDAVLDEVDIPTPVGLYRHLLALDNRRRDIARLRKGKPLEPEEDGGFKFGEADVEETATAFIAAIVKHAGSKSAQDVFVRIAKMIDPKRQWTDPQMAAVLEVVNEAFYQASRRITGPIEFVVYREHDQWLAVPWAEASLEQLQRMADDSQRRAERFAAVARRHRVLLETAMKAHDKTKGKTERLVELAPHMQFGGR